MLQDSASGSRNTEEEEEEKNVSYENAVLWVWDASAVMEFCELWVAACTEFAHEWDQWLSSGFGNYHSHRKGWLQMESRR